MSGDGGDGVRLQETMTRPDGGAGFVDRFVAFEGRAGGLRLGPSTPATSISFHAAPGDYDVDARPAPRRRMVLVAGGGLEIVTSDGERRVFRSGDVLTASRSSPDAVCRSPSAGRTGAPRMRYGSLRSSSSGRRETWITTGIRRRSARSYWRSPAAWR